MPTPAEILYQYWGYRDFRPLQQEIIHSILNSHDTLALLPTGGGKSVCYQVPAMLLPGVTIVISPLIALMQEQVARLRSLGISAEMISAGMHRADIHRILNNVAEGAYKMLYISPERLQTELFNEYLPVLHLSMVAIDEAHCISQWGHDFRPDYLQIATLKNIFPEVPFLALTASATKPVQDDIVRQLRLKDVQLFRQSFERKNINYSVRYSDLKNRDCLELVKDMQGSAIIYCRSRKLTGTLSKYLVQNGVPAAAYHAGMEHEKRKEQQRLWMADEVHVMVATTAFGMGIDKADVRKVIHYQPPEHLEAYYQESGRAGRDGKTAEAVLLYNSEDINQLNESTDTLFPPIPFIRQVYQAVAEYLQVPTGTEPHRYYDFELNDFCKKFNLPVWPASRALKLLEQEGLWTLTDAVFQPPSVQILAGRSEIDNIGTVYPAFHLLLVTMLRLYGTLFYHATPVNVKLVAKYLKTSAADVTQLLLQLNDMEVIRFHNPKAGPQLFFHHYRVDSQHLIIDTEKINTLKKLHEDRVKKVTDYTTNSKTCRTKLLLDYFDETTAEYCGHCDICNTKHSKPAQKNELVNKILDILNEQGHVPIPTLLNILNMDTVAADTIRELVDQQVIGMKGNMIFRLR